MPQASDWRKSAWKSILLKKSGGISRKKRSSSIKNCRVLALSRRSPSRDLSLRWNLWRHGRAQSKARRRFWTNAELNFTLRKKTKNSALAKSRTNFLLLALARLQIFLLRTLRFAQGFAQRFRFQKKNCRLRANFFASRKAKANGVLRLSAFCTVLHSRFLWHQIFMTMLRTSWKTQICAVVLFT